LSAVERLAVAFVAGYLIGRGVRLAVTLLGAALVILILLERMGYAAVDWARITQDAYSAASGVLERLAQGELPQLDGDSLALVTAFALGLAAGSGLVLRLLSALLRLVRYGQPIY